MVMAFLDDHRADLGIEPVFRELAIAPSSYHEHAARLADPGQRPARARRDDEIRQEFSRGHEASFRKVWHQLRREGTKVAKCTVERLMQSMGLAGIRRGKTTITTVSNPKAPCPLDKVNREFKVSRPNALWVVDFTYVQADCGGPTVIRYQSRRSDDGVTREKLRGLAHQRRRFGYGAVTEARGPIGRYLSFSNSRRPHSSLAAKTPDQTYFDNLPVMMAG